MPEQVEIAIEMNVVNGSRATLEGGEAEEGSSQGDAADQCPICLDGFERRTNTSCGHTFCSSCILKVLDHQQKQNKSLECPYCKQLVTYLRTEEPGSYTFSCMPELTQEAISILNERLMYLKVFCAKASPPAPSKRRLCMPLLWFLLRTLMISIFIFFMHVIVLAIDIQVRRFTGDADNIESFFVLILIVLVIHGALKLKGCRGLVAAVFLVYCKALNVFKS